MHYINQAALLVPQAMHSKANEWQALGPIQTENRTEL